MLVIGLTGSIGMGKSTVAAMLRARGIATLDADAVVHELYGGKAAPLVDAAFPGALTDGVVDRKKLAAMLMAEPGRFARLEAIVHPLVREAEAAFLAAEQRRGADMAVLEIPLLYETGAEMRCDVVIVASAPAAVQRQRVLERPGMTADRLAQLLARQIPDSEKRSRADFIVDTGLSLSGTEAEVDAIVATLRGRSGTAYHRYWAPLVDSTSTT